MYHSPEFCRAQAARHTAHAEATVLPNQRWVALTAAQRWLREADIAELIIERRTREASADVG